MKAYTKKQRDLLEFIAAYQQEHGVSPTLEEMGRKFGVHRVTMFQHVAALERRGAVRRATQLARGLEILDPDFLPARPLQVVGEIAAGRPIEAVETPEPVEADEYLPRDGDHYCLRVRGDSMIEDGIREGDLVVCRRTSTARNGDVVVAIVGDEEATLKRFHRLPDGRVRLEPANSRMKPVVFDRCQIRGVVVSLVRRI